MKILTTLITAGIITLTSSISASAAEVITFVAGNNFCEVVIRAGNTPNPENHPIVFQGKMNKGETFSYQTVFLWAQREGNPGVCGSGRAHWNQCSWKTCTIN